MIVAYKSLDTVNISMIISFSSLQARKVITLLSILLKNDFSFEEFGGHLDAEVLTQFIDAGGNVLVAGSNTIGEILYYEESVDLKRRNHHILGDAVREFAGECGIEFADDKNAVIDHLNYDIHDNGQVRSEVQM